MRLIGRRRFGLRWALWAALLGVLAACGSAPATPQPSAAAPTALPTAVTSPAFPTVVALPTTAASTIAAPPTAAPLDPTASPDEPTTAAPAEPPATATLPPGRLRDGYADVRFTEADAVQVGQGGRPQFLNFYATW